MNCRVPISLFLIVCAVSVSAVLSSPETAAVPESKDLSADAAVERARREVRMLDDIYKTAIVLITEHYVKVETDLPAGRAFKALFEAVEKKGWHSVRLMDASGEPYSEDNLPKDGFEKKAIREILAGKASVDEVITEGDKRFLLAATAIPVVMEKCIMCHENYRNVPKGQAIGAISYKVPVLE